MSQVEAGLEEPEHFLGYNLNNMLDHWPSDPAWPWGRGGGDRGKCRLDLLYSEGSRWEGCNPWKGGQSAPGALKRGSGKKVVANSLAHCWGVLAMPSGPLSGGTGVERVPEPHLASFQMLSGVADSQILV